MIKGEKRLGSGLFLSFDSNLRRNCNLWKKWL